MPTACRAVPPSLAAAVLCCAIVCSAGGCGGRGLVKAAGKVTLDGKPLSRATVMLVPEVGQPAVCVTGDDGAFSLASNNDQGATVGKYKVTVYKDEPVGAQAEPTPGGAGKSLAEASSEELARGMKVLYTTPLRPVVPPRYSILDQTPLSCEIPPGGIENLQFDLTSKP